MAISSGASGCTPERWPSESISIMTSKRWFASLPFVTTASAAVIESTSSVSAQPLRMSASARSSLSGAMQTA